MKEKHTNIIPTLNDLLRLEYLIASTGFSLLPRQKIHSVLAGKFQSNIRGRGLDFEESRLYAAGDDIRNIDWRVTARTKQTHTKVFTEEKEKPSLIITDMSPSMIFGSIKYTKAFIAAQLAAIGAFKILKNADRFGGLIFNHETEAFIRPHRSRKALLQYFNHLVDYAQIITNIKLPVTDNTPYLEKALHRIAGLATHDYTLLVISDFNHTSTTLSRQLALLSQHNDVILAAVNDPLEKQLSNQKMVITDGKLQLLWKARYKQYNEKYKITCAEERKSFQNEIMKYRIPMMELNTYDPIEDQLKKLFRNHLQTQH